MIQTKKYGIEAPNPPVSADLEGAPAGVPGGNDGKNKAKMEGTPVKEASLSPSFSPDIPGMSVNGSPAAGKTMTPLPSASALARKGSGTDGSGSSATGSASGNAGTGTPDVDDADEESAPRYGNMQDVIDWLEYRKSQIHMPSKKELQKELRRRRTSAIVSGITDAASALSNLITTTKYAPDMYDPSTSLSARNQERYERLQKQREADADRYYNYSMNIAKLKEGEDEKRYKHARDAFQDKLRQADAEHKAKLSDIKYQVLAQKLSDAQAAALTKDADDQLNRTLKQAKIDYMKSQTRKNDRYQPRGSGGGRGGGSKNKYPVYDRDGNVLYRVPTKYEGISESAKHGGSYPVQISEGTDSWGDPKKNVKRYEQPAKKKKNRLGL